MNTLFMLGYMPIKSFVSHHPPPPLPLKVGQLVKKEKCDKQAEVLVKVSLKTHIESISSLIKRQYLF